VIRRSQARDGQVSDHFVGTTRFNSSVQLTTSQPPARRRDAAAPSPVAARPCHVPQWPPLSRLPAIVPSMSTRASLDLKPSALVDAVRAPVVAPFPDAGPRQKLRAFACIHTVWRPDSC